MRDYEPNTEQILALYEQLQSDIIAAMIKRILKMGFVSESTVHQAEQLQHAGLLLEEISAIIAQSTPYTTEELKKLFIEAGAETIEIDKTVYEESGKEPVTLMQSDSMKQVLESSFQRTKGTLQNLTATTAIETQQAFIQTCDRAYMQITSGAFSYQEAIRMAVQNAAACGGFVHYPTGHRDRLDVAARRCILTGASQAAAQVAMQNAKELDCNFMELTAHSGARPEHAVWQGQLVSLNGEHAGESIDGLRVLSLSDIRYGEGRGFKGWNCRHSWHPYIIGISTPNYTPEQLRQLDEPCIEYDGKMYTEYEISQMQRYRERKVRKLKRETMALQTAFDNAEDSELKAKLHGDYSAKALRLKVAERELADFCKATKQDRDRFREQVLGFGRSEAQRAVWANKKALTSVDDGGIIRDKRIVDAVKSKKITLKLNPEKQNPHILGTPGYDISKNKSYFNITLEEVQSLVEKYYGTGNIKILSNGQIKETITIDSDDFAIVIDKDGSLIGNTNRFTVHYSNKRTHAVPTKKESE